MLKFLIIPLGLQVPRLLPFSSALSILRSSSLDVVGINIFCRSMEVTKELKMQRQSFDFQLTELHISPALISHALPLRPAALCVGKL